MILIENKEESLDKARARGKELGLANLRLIQANLDYFTGPFHIGVSSHGQGKTAAKQTLYHRNQNDNRSRDRTPLSPSMGCVYAG